MRKFYHTGLLLFTISFVLADCSTSYAQAGWTNPIVLEETLEQATQEKFKQSNPPLFDKLEQQTTMLQGESTKQSLQKLSNIEMFYWPGPRTGMSGSSGFEPILPLRKEQGQTALEAIISNRRFSKLVSELSKIEAEELAATLKAEINNTFTEHKKTYAKKLENVRLLRSIAIKKGKLNNASVIGGVGFSITNPPEGQVSVVGVRLKLLSLVWIAGILDVKACLPEIRQIADFAKTERDKMYEDDQLHSFVRSRILINLSAYHPQIIASAILALSNDKDSVDSFTDKHQIQWQQTDLTAYDAFMTPFDLPVRTLKFKPDFTRGNIIIHSVAPIEDSVYDDLLSKFTSKEN